MKRIGIEEVAKITWCLLLFLSLGMLSSCEDEGAEYIDELDLVVTRYNNDYDFTGNQTYLMPDTIIHVPEKSEFSLQDSLFDQAVLNRVESNMEALGYVRVVESSEGEESPHLVLTLTLIDRNYFGIYGWEFSPWYSYWSWYDWGYWGYPWIGPGWYPYYPIYWGSYGYSTGSLVVDMLQPQQEGVENHIPVLWNGIFKGAYSIGLNERMLKGVDQMFDQSPYLSQK